MKPQIKQYLLFGLVVVIWGGIFVRFYVYTDQGESRIQPIKIDSSLPDASEKLSEYRYYLNYADPFLKESSPEPSVAEQPVLRKSQPVIRLPRVDFVGVVSSGQKQTGILRIKGQTVMVNVGDEVHDFRIKNITENGLQLYYIPADSMLKLQAGLDQQRKAISQLFSE